jgi:hypothetical protein
MSVNSRRRAGRPTNPIPSAAWKVYIPLPIATKVDLLLLDPMTGRVRHGAKSAFVTQLLVEWLNARGVKLDPVTILTVEGGDVDGLQEER